MIESLFPAGRYNASFSNDGKEDSINVQVKIAGTDLDHTLIINLLQEKVYEIPKLRNGMVQGVNTATENDQDLSLIALLPVRSASCRGGAAARRRCRARTGILHVGCADG